MAIVRFHTYRDLVDYLVENHVPHHLEEENLAVKVPITSPPLDGLLYLRWEKRLPYVQIVHPFILDVPEARMPEVETALCRANSIIALPGLGVEYTKRFIFMRLCVPVYDDGILATSFQRQIAGALQNAKDFIGPLRDVVAGSPGKDVLALAVKHKVQLEVGAHAHATA